jgi:DNA repair ATPase RecN
MSAINYRTGSLKSPAKPKHLSQLKEFIAPEEKIFQDKEVSDYDRLFDDKKELEQRLLLKKQEVNAKAEELSALRSAKAEETSSLRSRTAETISNLKSENKALFEGFEKRVVLWDTGKIKQTDLEKLVKL